MIHKRAYIGAKDANIKILRALVGEEVKYSGTAF
jgi:hypothetical protein